MFEAGEFDVCTLIYAEFKSAISQIVTAAAADPLRAARQGGKAARAAGRRRPERRLDGAVYEYEPGRRRSSAPCCRATSVQVFKALLENAASEQGARMTAMDNATRNAGDMINKLTLVYNRTRQARSPRN
jgi:F-type H+-transporting ATPase subunit gamma